MAVDVVDGVSELWESEPVPDEDFLYVRIHQTFQRRAGGVSLGWVKNLPTPEHGMSTDWDKYATPEQTQARGRKPAREYAVGKLNAGQVRAIPQQSAVHTPDHENDNRAHTDIFGEKENDPEVRVMFGRIYTLAIGFENQRSL